MALNSEKLSSQYSSYYLFLIVNKFFGMCLSSFYLLMKLNLTSGPVCSKLMMLLVKEMLKFHAYCLKKWYHFLLKKM